MKHVGVKLMLHPIQTDELEFPYFQAGNLNWNAPRALEPDIFMN